MSNTIIVLRDLIKKLTSSELEQMMLELNSNRETKSGIILKEINRDGKISSKQLQILLYGRTNYGAFNKLLIRVKNKVLEKYIEDDSILKYNYSNRNKELFLLKKMIIKADVLSLRGLPSEALKIYQKVLKSSKKWEFYDIAVAACSSIYRLLANQSKTNKMRTFEMELRYLENTWLLLNRANTLFQEMMNVMSLSAESSSYSDKLKTSLSRLNEYQNETQSSIIKYYYNLLLSEKYLSENNYQGAISTFESLRDLLKQSPSAYTINRYGTVLVNLGTNYIYTKDFNKAISLLNESLSYFANQNASQVIIHEHIFLARFYKSEFSEAEEQIDTALNLHGAKPSFQLSKLYYYKSCLEFSKKRFDKSLEYLKIVSEIKNDKEGFDICRRIMILLCHIELNDYNNTDLDYQSLSKYIKRLSKKVDVNPRYISILKVLNFLINNNYDYKKLFLQRRKQISKIANEQELGWRINSPEIINFYSWLCSK